MAVLTVSVVAADHEVWSGEASMGVALAPMHAKDATRLLQRADVAMEAAKSTRSGVEIYDPVRGTNESGQLRLLADRRRAGPHRRG